MCSEEAGREDVVQKVRCTERQRDSAKYRQRRVCEKRVVEIGRKGCECPSHGHKCAEEEKKCRAETA